MKKSLVIIAAAAILASCSNESVLREVQDNAQPTMIGFSSYSEKATRGDVDNPLYLEYHHSTFSVYGTKKTEYDNEIAYVFGGTPTAAGAQDGEICKYQDATLDARLGDWRYKDPRFWDKYAAYHFIAYAPALDSNPIKYHYAAVNEVGTAGNWFKTTIPYVLRGTNVQATPTTAEKARGFNEAGKDLDLMTSTVANQAGATHDEFVNLQFRHLLAKLNIKFGMSEALYGCTVTIKEVKIEGIKRSGNYDESVYDKEADPRVSGWSIPDTATTKDLTNTNATVLNDGTYDNTTTPATFTPGAPYYIIESLVIPQNIADDQVTLTAKYSIKSGDYTENYTYVLDLYDITSMRQIYDGHNYTINFLIDPNLIKFDANVAAWDNETFNFNPLGNNP